MIPQKRRRLTLTAVFLLSLAILGFNIGGVGLAETYIDPISHIAAQDEAVYSSTSLHMAESGGWLTPMFLGRYAFYKPPLLYWAAGLSARLFGGSVWALRLPSLLAGAAVTTLLFAWMWDASGLAAAIAGCLLLVSDRLYHVLARLVLTDMLVSLWIVIAMTSLYRDPALARRRSLWIFGAAVSAAIMTKSLAGLLPLLILASSGVPLKRFAQVCGVAVLFAAPWHLYQLAAHTRWFWDEYVLTENFAWAVAAPQQSTQENQLLYYARRLWWTDPVLCVTAIAGIPVLIRTRNRLLVSWIGVVFLAFLGFGYRNASYLSLLIPALCLVSAGALRNSIPAGIVAVIAAARIATLPYHAEHPLPSVAALRSYAALHRPNDLIIAAPDDEFVSSTLGLKHVRYCFFDANPDRAPLPLDFRRLGVTLTVAEFNARGKLGLPSGAPIGTVILARSAEELRSLIASHPRSDFSLPDAFAKYSDDAHIAWDGSVGRLFLLGRE